MDSTRKRPAGGEGAEEEGRARTRPDVSDDRREVTDEEVEEFFAILRRMRDVARFFASGDGSAGGSAEPENRSNQGAWRWRPTFVREDFEDQAAVGTAQPQRSRKRCRDAPADAEEEDVVVAENGIGERALDLNAEPGPRGGRNRMY